jgi:hypothetical protein
MDAQEVSFMSKFMQLDANAPAVPWMSTKTRGDFPDNAGLPDFKSI